MNRSPKTWISVSVPFLLLSPGFVLADPAPAAKLLDAHAMSARIDHHIGAKLTAQGVKPAARTSDAEFFRRINLDLNGRIPSITHLRDFLDDARPNKRQIWINKLMDGRDPDFSRIEKALPELYVRHFTTFWRTVIFSQTTSPRHANLAFQLDPWLRRGITENRPYDRLIADLLTGQGQPFFQANENKPENLAGTTARLFLGVKLECAQCHEDRSGGTWTREQFWEYAAFFVETQSKPPSTNFPPTIKIPEKNQVIEARFLDGEKPEWKAGDNPRLILTTWMTSANNPYFARAAVNRMWDYFFGIGLVDPVDLMAIEENPPSHPELLDELAYQFAAHQFDLQYLIRAITLSEAYQRTSAKSDATQDEPRLFARMAMRGMTPEQLFDSVQLATGQTDTVPGGGNPFAVGRSNPRVEFITGFANNKDRRTETQTSVLQALYLMNSRFVSQALESKGGFLDIISAANVPMSRRIEEIYLVVLSRKPRPQELDRLLKLLEKASLPTETKEALADIYWTLLNSAEFLLNH